MNKIKLGNTGLEVSELCFGALPLGPLQKNLDLEKGKELIKYALEKGINFIDTAEMYQTYPYIKDAISEFERDKVVIASKSTAETYQQMEKEINKGLEELELEYFDIFHLHAARELNPFQKRAEAIKCLLDYKDKGIIKNIGIATHSVEVVEKATNNKDIDIIFALLNLSGRGIIDGEAEDMATALDRADQKGKGIYIMKALAGGVLLERFDEALSYIRNKPFNAPVAIGMVNKREVDLNFQYFFNYNEFNKDNIEIETKDLVILNPLCEECGKCVELCPNTALQFENDKLRVNKDKCILCGYCTRSCPEFCIRIA